MPTPLQRASKELQSSLQSLQSLLSKPLRKDISLTIPFPQKTSTGNPDSPSTNFSPATIDQNARDLEDAIDVLIAKEEERNERVRSGVGTTGEKVKELVRKWYRGMSPFLDLVLRVSMPASQISVLNPYGVIAGALIMINEFAYKQSGRRSEIDEMMKDLSIPLRRIQLTTFIKNGRSRSGLSTSDGFDNGNEIHLEGADDAEGLEGDDPALTGVKVAALSVLTAIVETLIFDIHYLSDSGLAKVRKSLSPSSTSESALRMALKAASDAYTDAMVDLGLAKTIQLAEIVEAGFERLENSVRKGIPSGSAGAGGGMSLAAVGGGGDPFDSWLSKYADTNAKERNKHLSLQETTNPSWIYSRPEFQKWLNPKSDSANTSTSTDSTTGTSASPGTQATSSTTVRPTAPTTPTTDLPTAPNTRSPNPRLTVFTPPDSAKNIYLYATTGYGKSVLAAYLTSSLPVQVPGSKVAYFFCKESQINVVDQVIRDLLYQVTAVDKGSYELVKEIWSSERGVAEGTVGVRDFVERVVKVCLEGGGQMEAHGGSRIGGTTLDGIHETIETKVETTTEAPPSEKTSTPTTSTTTFLIIDALNELPSQSQSEVLRLLAYLTQIPSLRIIVTSQLFDNLISAFKKWTPLELQASFHEKTIEEYVREQMAEMPQVEKWFEKAEVDPLKFFGDNRTGHKGMFIYPATMLRYLRQTYTYEDFSMVLASVPQDINALYRASLIRLQKSHSRSLWLWIKEIFSWVTLPPRDIGVEQLREGISVSRKIRLHESPSPSAANIDIQKILATCGAFLHTHLDPISKSPLITIVHNTFDNFIISDDCPPDFKLNHYDTLHLRTLSLMQYLGETRIDRLDTIHVSKVRRDQWSREHPLFKSASELWYTWLVYLGPGTFEGTPEELISRVLELAQGLMEFSRQDRIEGWIRSVITFNESELDDTFSSIVAKAFRTVLVWMGNHEEFFKLNLREGKDGLEVVPRSRRHVVKYLEMVKSVHLGQLETKSTTTETVVEENAKSGESKEKSLEEEKAEKERQYQLGMAYLNSSNEITASPSRSPSSSASSKVGNSKPTTKPRKIKPPPFSFSLQFRKTFRTSNTSRYQSYLTSCLAAVWLSTEAKHYSHSMACFFELCMLYQTTKLGDTELEEEPKVPHEEGVDFVALVKDWAVPEVNDSLIFGRQRSGRRPWELGHCGNVNIAHAYKWYFGSKEPGNPRDLRLAIKHYKLALQDHRIHFTGRRRLLYFSPPSPSPLPNCNPSSPLHDLISGDILQSLSRASSQLFNTTIQPSDLFDAIKFASEAVEITPPEDPLKGKYTAELCDLLCKRAVWNTDVSDADKAVDLARQQLMAGGPGTEIPGIRGTLRRVLISSLVTNYQMTGKEEYVNEALREFGIALQSLPGPAAQKLFGSLRKLYGTAGAEGIVLPTPETPDPFQPFFDCLLTLSEEYFSDFQKFMEIFWDPDLMEQAQALDCGLISIVLHYQHGRRLSLALAHCLELIKFSTSILEWFRGLIPKTEDIEQWASYMEYMADRAEVYIVTGDMLWDLGKEEEARQKWEAAKKDLEVGKENVYSEMTKRCLRPEIWQYRGSKFVEFYRDWLEGEDGKKGK